MPEPFFVRFDYDVRPAGRTALRRDTTRIEIAAVQSRDLPVAYRVANQRDLGPERHLILRHDGQLWWPLVEIMPGLEIRSARDFLHDLRADHCDLFVRKPLDHLFLEPWRRRRIVHDGYDDALAAVHRNARDLLVVDDGLYAAGGVPILVNGFRGVCVAGTGADRAVAAPSGALRIKPALGHRDGIDFGICWGSFHLQGYPPGLPELAEVLADSWSYYDWITIETVDGEPIDGVTVRIDAAFRTAWAAMNRSVPRTRPDGFESLFAQFADACGPGEDGCLTVARYRALQNFVELYGNFEPKPIAVRKCLRGVQRTLSDAAYFWEVAPDLEPEGLRVSLSDDDEAALATLAV